MVNYTNRDYITSLSATDTTDGIKDGTDKLHASIIRTLEQSARGNYVVSYGASNFVQEAGSTRTRFKFSGNISFMRDGVVTTSTPTQVELDSNPDATYNRYDLIVINASDALDVREGTAAASSRTPDNLTAGDIPVALVEVAAGSGANVTTRKVQLFGYDKTSNALSIARDSSSVYTEMGTISCDSDSIDIATTNSNADINLTPHGTGTIKLGGNLDVNSNSIVSDSGNENIVIAPHGSGQVVIGNQGETVNRLSSNGARDLKLEANSGVGASITLEDGTNGGISISPNGTGDVTIGTLPIDGDQTVGSGQDGYVLTYTHSNGKAALAAASSSASDEIVDADSDTKIQVEESADEDKIRFDTAGSERMIIDDSGNVGIGTHSPDKLLHLSATTDATLRIESTKTSVAADDVIGAIEWEGQDSSTGSAGVGAKIDVINENATPDFAMRFFTQKAVGGTPTFSEKMRIASDGKVAIGNTSPSVELDVTGQFRLSSHAELNGNLDHDGSNIGFFGTAVAAQQSVGNLGSTAVQARPAPNPGAFNGFEPGVDNYIASLETEIGNLRTKVDALIDALQLYGLIT